MLILAWEGKRAAQVNHRNFFYKVADFEVVMHSTFWISTMPNEVSKGWDAACNCLCTYALFRDKKSKKQFLVFNTYLDHLGATGRINGIKLALSQINALNAKEYPVFLWAI